MFIYIVYGICLGVHTRFIGLLRSVLCMGILYAIWFCFLATLLLLFFFTYQL